MSTCVARLSDHSFAVWTGVFAERHQKSADGYEMTWAVNVMAPFLLTSLLLDSVCLIPETCKSSHMN
jgi:hypothetical protein